MRSTVLDRRYSFTYRNIADCCDVGLSFCLRIAFNSVTWTARIGNNPIFTINNLHDINTKA